jgi:RNA polymerase sigma-70 factor (ECF subfamily)
MTPGSPMGASLRYPVTIIDTHRAARVTLLAGPIASSCEKAEFPLRWRNGWADTLKMNAADEAVAPSDVELIEKISSGDRASFSVLYERYFRRVYHFAGRRINNRADIEETVQEVFTNIFTSLESFRSEGPFAAWVFGVARRTIANRFKKKRHPMLPLDLEDESRVIGGAVGREPTPLEHYECRERLERLQTAADCDLSPIQRQLIEMHHLQHQSIREIARATDKSADAVKSDLYRARRALLAR